MPDVFLCLSLNVSMLVNIVTESLRVVEVDFASLGQVEVLGADGDKSDTEGKEEEYRLERYKFVGQ